jgi:hypothetical protein
MLIKKPKNCAQVKVKENWHNGHVSLLELKILHIKNRYLLDTESMENIARVDAQN